MAKKTKNNNFTALKVATVLFLTLLLLAIAVAAHNYRRELRIANDFNNELLFLLRDINGGVEGKSCGVLNTNKASDILGSEVIKDAGSKQGVFALPQNSVGDAALYWSDSCQYQDVKTSDRYVELYISTYENEVEAKSEYERILPKVNNAESILINGKTVLYDAGVIYSINDKQIVQVAAGNGATRGQKEFVVNVYKQLVPELL